MSNGNSVGWGSEGTQDQGEVSMTSDMPPAVLLTFKFVITLNTIFANAYATFLEFLEHMIDKFSLLYRKLIIRL